jgi:hypothetical protein
LAYLRKAAKSYVAIVPGAGFFVDSAFDSVDEVFDAHQEEANAITQRAYDEVRAITRQNDDSLETAVKVTDVLKKYLVDLHGLGMKAGGSVINPMWEKYPAAKEKLDGAFDELRRLAEQGGPGAKRIFDDTQQQVSVPDCVPRHVILTSILSSGQKYPYKQCGFRRLGPGRKCCPRENSQATEGGRTV